MKIGIPRERKQGECRVAVTPEGVLELTSAGHQVLIETNAGEKSGFLDSEYISTGATIASTLEETWNSVELLVKVKEPSPEEIPLLRSDLIIFCFLHHAAFPELTQQMLDAGVTSFDYDLVTLTNGRLPILEPMSVIAGKLAAQAGAYSLQSHVGGRGVLLGGTESVSPGKVVVIGAGAAGTNAAEVAYGMGAEVVLLDIKPEKLKPYEHYGDRMTTRISSKEVISEEIINADLVIGSVLIPGDKAPKLITKEMLQTMQQGSVIVDICIDQGGFAETSQSTSIAEPTYVVDGVVHYCVPNMPALVPRTSTKALTSKTLHWIKLIAKTPFKELINDNEPLQKSLTIYKGQLTNSTIGQALGLSSAPVKL